MDLVEFEGTYNTGEVDSFVKGGELYISEKYFPNIAIYNGKTIDVIRLEDQTVVIIFIEEEKDGEFVNMEYFSIHIPLRFYDYYTVVTRTRIRDKIDIEL